MNAIPAEMPGKGLESFEGFARYIFRNNIIRYAFYVYAVGESGEIESLAEIDVEIGSYPNAV